MINGVINVRKEAGMTSFGVVSRMRKILNQKKIGHTGTLDPDAEGVLPVCIGRGTHLVEDLSRGTKSYRALLLLGQETDTQDTTGTVLQTYDVDVTEEEVREAILSFRGKQMQMPPMYSALKVNGKKLVDLARKGIEVERKAREVEFSEIVIHSVDLPHVDFSVTVSHGTYIRTLCYDIGRKLGVGGCMEHLIRTRVEEFDLKDALTLDEIRERKDREEEPYSFVIPIDHFYRHLPSYRAEEEWTRKIANGSGVPVKATIPHDPSKHPEDPRLIEEGAEVRLYTHTGDFAGIYKKDKGFLVLKKFFYDGAGHT